MCGPMTSPKVDIRSWESNSEPYDREANTLPHDHRNHIKRWPNNINPRIYIEYWIMFQKDFLLAQYLSY